MSITIQTLPPGPSFIITLPTIDIGNTMALETFRSHQITSSGQTHVFNPVLRPYLQTVTFTGRNICDDDVIALRNYLRTWAGITVDVLMNNERIYRGIIMNPNAAITRDHNNRNSVSLVVKGYHTLDRP